MSNKINKDTYKSNVNKFVTSSILDNTANVIMSSSFIVAYGLYLGMTDWMIGVLVSINEIAAVAQFFTAILFRKIGESKKAVLIMYSLYRIFGYLPILVPFITQDVSIRALIFIIFMGISNICGTLDYAPLINWQMSLIDEKDRGRIQGKKEFITKILGMIVLFLVGIVLEKATTQGFEYIAFLLMFTSVVVISGIDIGIRIFTYKPRIERSKEKILLRDIFKIPFSDIKFRKILIYMCIAKIGISLGFQYVSLYQIKYIEINYIFVSILSFILSTSTGVAAIYVGNKLRNRSWKRVLVSSYVFMVLSYIILILTNKDSSFLLIISTSFYGISLAGINLFKTLAVYSSAPVDKKIMYVSVYSAISGMMTVITTIMGKALIDNITFMNPIIFVFLLSIVVLVFAIIYISKNLDI